MTRIAAAQPEALGSVARGGARRASGVWARARALRWLVLSLVLGLGLVQGVQAIAWMACASPPASSGGEGEADDTAGWVRSDRPRAPALARAATPESVAPPVAVDRGPRLVRTGRHEVGRHSGRELLHRQRRLLI